MNRKARKYQAITARAAIRGNIQTIVRASQELGEKYHFVKYWRTKLRQPNFHTGTVGGARHVKFGERSRTALEALLRNELKRDPLQNATELAAFARRQGFHVNARFVQRILQAWNWSSKQAKQWAPNKFSFENIVYYVLWVSTIVLHPILRIKYLDAANFEERSLHRQRGLAPRGRRIAVQMQQLPASDSWTCFCLTDLNHARGFWVSRAHTGRNDSIDFLRFLLQCIGCGGIAPGDMIVGDNASIHRSGLSTRVTDTLMAFIGARMLFLPAYAPELNPCEAVWARVKYHLREQRGNLSFQAELLKGFLQIDLDMVKGFYHKSLFNYRD